MAGCIYEHLENGVHQFVFTGEGENGMDEFFDLLTQVLAKAPPDTEVLRYLVHLTGAKGQAPMSELVKRFRRIDIALPQRPAGRTAIIVESDLFLTLANTLISTLAPSRDQTKFFKKTQVEQAMEWVTRND